MYSSSVFKLLGVFFGSSLMVSVSLKWLKLDYHMATFGGKGTSRTFHMLIMFQIALRVPAISGRVRTHQIPGMAPSSRVPAQTINTGE